VKRQVGISKNIQSDSYWYEVEEESSSTNLIAAAVEKRTSEQQQGQQIMSDMELSIRIPQLIEACNNEHNIDKRIEILYHINSILAKQHQLKIPSLITNAYINTALYKIEETFCQL
jgi:hypothetical protein